MHIWKVQENRWTKHTKKIRYKTQKLKAKKKKRLHTNHYSIEKQIMQHGAWVFYQAIISNENLIYDWFSHTGSGEGDSGQAEWWLKRTGQDDQ